MMRCYAFVLTLVGAMAACDRSLAARGSHIIPEPAARRHGLTRPWFTQIQIDRARGRVTHIVLDSGMLFVQTDQAVVHAVDAETGQTKWVAQVGRRDHPSLAAAANQDFVAVINGSYLYVLNRENGKLLWKTQLEETPGSGAVMSHNRVYVPMVKGMVLSYLLQPMKDPLEELAFIRQQQELSPEDEETMESERRGAITLSQEYVPPLACQSFGRSLVQPIVMRQTEDEQYVAWPTDRGFLFVGYLSERDEYFTIRYQLKTEAGIAARPAYSPPSGDILPDSGVIYAASRDGFVHAITERRGDSVWRFSTAEPILEAPVVINESLYVVPQPGGMYCLDAKTGTEKWWAPQVAQFIAASRERLYVADKLERILVLNAASGARLDTIPAEGLDIKFCNTQTDRIYLATASGLIQCLHEVELAEPILHQEPPEPPPEEPPAEKQPAEGPPAKQAPAVNPFDAPASADAFGAGGAGGSGGGQANSADGGAQGNPFGNPADDPFN
jgi:hypothetical protein